MAAARALAVERGHALRDQRVQIAAGQPEAPVRALVLGERDPAAAGLPEVIVRLAAVVDHRAGVGERLELRRVRDRWPAVHRAIAVGLVDAEPPRRDVDRGVRTIAAAATTTTTTTT